MHACRRAISIDGDLLLGRVISVDRSDGSRALTSRAALGRRQFLHGAAAVGAGGLIAACSSGSSTKGASTSSTVSKRGGNLTVGLSGSSGADTLDPHASLTFIDSARAQPL